MHINEVYAVQNAINAEIKLRECNLKTKATVAHRDIKKIRLEIQETEHKKLEWKGNYQKISKAVILAC